MILGIFSPELSDGKSVDKPGFKNQGLINFRITIKAYSLSVSKVVSAFINMAASVLQMEMRFKAIVGLECVNHKTSAQNC